MIHVHILYEYGIDHKPHGSSFIRLLLPLQHPSLADRIRVTTGETFEKSDIVIIDRTWKYNVTLDDAQRLLRAIRKAGALMLYQLDDNLLDLDLSDSFRSPFTFEQLAVVRLFAREADGLIVSTPPLAERMRRLNAATHVLPNALDEQIFNRGRASVPRPRSGKLRVGYMGTFTHEQDLFMILEALRPLAQQMELKLIGGIQDTAAIKAFAPLDVKVETPDCGHEYPAFARWMVASLDWDIGLAPLEDKEFTRCKSDIKFLDYSLLGIPGCYSNVPAYQHTVQHGVTGLLTDNTPADWHDALSRLINQPALRLDLGRAAEQWVRHHRTLSVCAGQWAEIIERTVTQKANPDSTR